MRDREATAAIRALAERQHGVVAHWQLLELGVERSMVLGRRQAGLLISLHRGVYALGHGRLSREGRWMAAVLACGPGAVLSHFSAATFGESVAPMNRSRFCGSREASNPAGIEACGCIRRGGSSPGN